MGGLLLLLETDRAGRRGGSTGLELQDGEQNKERGGKGREGPGPRLGAGLGRVLVSGRRKGTAEFEDSGSGGGQKGINRYRRAEKYDQ